MLFRAQRGRNIRDPFRDIAAVRQTLQAFCQYPSSAFTSFRHLLPQGEKGTPASTSPLGSHVERWPERGCRPAFAPCGVRSGAWSARKAPKWAFRTTNARSHSGGPGGGRAQRGRMRGVWRKRRRLPLPVYGERVRVRGSAKLAGCGVNASHSPPNPLIPFISRKNFTLPYPHPLRFPHTRSHRPCGRPGAHRVSGKGVGAGLVA
jgi:hypothetical protein